MEEGVENKLAYKKFTWSTINLYSNQTGRLIAKVRDLVLLVKTDGYITSTGTLQVIDTKYYGGNRRYGSFHIDFSLKDSDGDTLQRVDNVVNVYSWSGCNSDTPFTGGRSYNANLYEHIQRAAAHPSIRGFNC